MFALTQSALARVRPHGRRPAAFGAGLALAAAVNVLVLHVAPGAPTVIALGLSGLAGAAALALACALAEKALGNLIAGALAGAGLAFFGAFLPSQEARLRLFSLTMVAVAAALTIWLVRTATRRPIMSPGRAALYLATLAPLSAYSAYVVLTSRDLMIADFMTCRGIAIMIARLAHSGDWALLAIAAAESIAKDYSWFPALAPGLVLAAAAPFSRALYTFALLALYAAPAAIALAILARDLARRAMPSPRPSPAKGVERRPSFDGLCGRGGDIPSPARGRRWPHRAFEKTPVCRRAMGPDEGRRFPLPLGLAAVIAAYPAGLAVAARGMPDVGGLVLVVIVLKLAERLARLLALPKGRESRVAAMTRRVSVALALTMFAMFAFRRWYAFAAAGIATALALEIARIAFTRGAGLRLREVAAAGALGTLTLLALAFPVIVDWLPDLSAHDYVSAYAAYRKPSAVFLSQLSDWVGLLPALAGLIGASYLWTRSTDRRLLRLTLGGVGVAALLFLRVQTPYIHHLYLVAPALTAPVAAGLMIAYARAPRAALAGLAGLAALTLSPLAYALNPLGLTPIAGLPRPPRSDLAELDRMKDWVEARAARRQGLRPRLELYF